MKRSEPKGHDLLREHHAKVMEEMKELVSKVSSLERRIESLRLFVVSGERQQYPWQRLRYGRTLQVNAVVDYLTAHPTVTIPRACQATFQPRPDGYPSWKALRSYCYSIGIRNYVKARPAPKS